MNYRNSKQGTIILEILSEANFHPSASDLYDIVRKQIPDISLATIYRNLEKLVKQQKINKFKTPNGLSLYDGNLKKHYHIFCSICGKTNDIWIDHNFEEDLCKQNCNFNDIKVQISFNGICNKCKLKQNREG